MMIPLAVQTNLCLKYSQAGMPFVQALVLSAYVTGTIFGFVRDTYELSLA